MAFVLRSTYCAIGLSLLSACSTEHEFRVAGVGSESAEPTAENTTVAGEMSPLVVAAGNVLLGRASQLSAISPYAPSNGVVNGTVAAVLVTTGQTLVELPDGASLLLNGRGAALGDTVSIDALQGIVVPGTGNLSGSSVIGSIGLPTVDGTSLVAPVSVSPNIPGLNTSVAGQLLTGGTAGAILGTPRASASVIQATSGTITNVSGAVTGVLGPTCC